MEFLPARILESRPQPKCSYEIKRDAKVLKNKKKIDRILKKNAEVQSPYSFRAVTLKCDNSHGSSVRSLHNSIEV